MGSRAIQAAICVLAWSAGRHSANAQNTTAPASSVASADPGRPGVYRLDVTDPPADGRFRITMPARDVVRCLLDGDEPQSLRFESGEDGNALTVLFPSPREHGRPLCVIIETSDVTKQHSDGRIVFRTADAKVESDPDTVLNWSFDATRWGTYSLQVTYAAAERNDGATAEARIGSTKLSAALEPTESPRRFATADLGTLYLAEPGRKTLSLRLDDAPGLREVEIRAVLLVPACEGTPPVQTGDQPITLHGRDSVVRGTNLRYEPASAKQTLGYWTRADDAAEWSFDIATPGAYDVEVLQGCGAGQGGSEVVIAVAGRELPFEVKETGHFQNFEARIVGQIEFPATGRYRLTVRPRRIANKAALDLRQVRLIPSAG